MTAPLPVSPGELIAFTPEGCDGENPPVYRVAVASHKTRALYQRQMQAEGAFLPADAEVRAAAERAIRDEVAADQQAELLAVVAAHFDDPDADPAAYLDLVAQLQAVSPELARLFSARVYFKAMYPIVACQVFLKGAANVDPPLKFAGGMLAEESLNALPAHHVEAIGVRALELMALSEGQRKNSASPSPSPSAPASTTAGSTPRKAATGRSSATSTGPTPATS